MEAVLAKVVDPDGRTIVLTRNVWAHIMSAHPELAAHQQAIMETITHPTFRENDARPGRERFYAHGRGPAGWLRVVVAFDDTASGRVVTAFGQRAQP